MVTYLRVRYRNDKETIEDAARNNKTVTEHEAYIL